jgi:UDP-glucose:(heptosyl)LPS alpha-1,3-glucosyltransferase
MSTLAERLVYRPSRVRAFVAVSGGGARELAEAYPKIADSIVTVPNGIDTNDFRPRSDGGTVNQARAACTDLGLPDDVPVAAFVGGDWERKGLELAIRALADASPWHLAVAGAGDEVRYASLASDLAVGDRVHFLGSRSDVPQLFRACDVFLLPSAYETFSLVTYEAAASGLPLLVTRVSGVEDLLVDGHNGYFIARDERDIAQKLTRLYTAPPDRLRMGQAAREDSLAHTTRQMLSGYAALYRALAPAA